MKEIKHVQQPSSFTCVHACLAMVTGEDVHGLVERFGDHGLSFHEKATVLVEHKIWPVNTTFQGHPFDTCGVYLVGTCSLNLPGKMHCVVVEASGDGYTVYDPNEGREGMDYYKDEDIMSGRLSRCEVFYLDTITLRKMWRPTPVIESAEVSGG